MKKVAICIPAFSNPQNIDYCIESVISSNNNFFDIDILLYNNSDKVEIIETCQKLTNDYKFIRLFDYRYNLGCSRTWNEAIEFVNDISFFGNRKKVVEPRANECLVIKQDGSEILGLAYTEIIPLLVASIKELKALVDTQATEIAQLKAKVG